MILILILILTFLKKRWNNSGIIKRMIEIDEEKKESTEKSHTSNASIEEVFKFIEKKELQTLLKMVKSGQILTPDHSKRLEELQAKISPSTNSPLGKWHRTLSDMTEFYNIAASTLLERMKAPDFPPIAKIGKGIYDLKIINDWMIAHFYGKDEETCLAAEKLRYQKFRADREQYSAEKERDKLVEVNRVVSGLSFVFTGMRQKLMSWYKSLPPLLIGLEEKEMSIRIREETISLLNELKQGTDLLKPKKKPKKKSNAKPKK